MNGHRKFSTLQLILPSHVVADLKAEAKRQGVSVITLVRNTLEQHLGTRVLSMRVGGRTIHLRLDKVDLNKPKVYMTPKEISYAQEAMRIFREEDR